MFSTASFTYRRVQIGEARCGYNLSHDIHKQYHWIEDYIVGQ